jgi:HK97 family phage major capsid protein
MSVTNKEIRAGIADVQKLMRSRSLTKKESEAYAVLVREAEAREMSFNSAPDYDTRGVKPGPRRPQAGEVRGDPGEPVQVGHAREWYDKARENGVRVSRVNGDRGMPLSAESRDFDLNAYWGQKLGLARPGAESRALGEDTGGSGQAITPQSWVADYVDVLLPNTILGKVGARTVMMDRETVNVPIFSSTVSPSWIAEAGSISLDANPAFAPLALFAPGGFKDITQFSVELAQDAYIRGDLPGMLAQAVARKMLVVLDTSAILGVAGNTGIPGLNGETGFVKRHYTGDAGTTGKAPTDTTELGVVAELTLKTNATANAFVSNVGCAEAFRRIPLATYGRYFDTPSVAAQCVDNWITSENSALPYVETDPATASTVAQSGGAYTSLYAGPWDQFAIVGMHLDLQTRVLNERYIDSGELALFSWCRYSIRFAHPETFSRTIGIIPV